MKKIKNVLIFGAGGIGSALVRELISFSTVENIFITYYKNKPSEQSSKVKAFKLDCSSEREVMLFFKELENHTPEINLTINTVGLLFDEKNMPEKSLNQISQPWLEYSFKINSFSFLYISKYLKPFLSKKDEGAIITLSAKVGSIKDNKSGGWYSYRASKAALNMFVKSLALELARTHRKTMVLSIHPGTTDTSFTKPFQSRFNYKLHSAKDTAQNILEIIKTRSANDTGLFLSWDNTEIEY